MAEPLCYISDITGKKETLIHKVKIRIVDGDTIHIEKQNIVHGIDAPEINLKKKSYAFNLKYFLESLVKIMCKRY